MIPTNQKKVYTSESTLLIEKDEQSPISLCISAYEDCIFVIINQTGGMGSILRGEVASLAEPDLDDDIDFQNPNQQEMKKKQELIYEQKVLFGNTSIQFYEMVMRKLLEVFFEENKVQNEKDGSKMKIILNISLKINKEGFDQMAYYQVIMKEIKNMLKEVL